MSAPTAPTWPPPDVYVAALRRGVPYGYWVRGWIERAAARQPQWLQRWGGREQAFFVPADALHPINRHVVLTVPMVRDADAVGLRRNVPGHRPAHGAKTDPITALWNHLVGARGERAVYLAYGVPWTGTVDTFKAPDLGVAEIRTRSAARYDLIVRWDDTAAKYILVTPEADA